MKKTVGILFLFFLLCGFAKSSTRVFATSHYNISDTLWFQLPSAKYHIIRWNTKEQYVIARNGTGNPGDGGLYTRIDYMPFKNMEPFLWGFCLSNFNAQSDSLAEFSPTRTDRLNPRKGCNGYPFSRMKKVD
jgi:hypothetical protein